MVTLNRNEHIQYRTLGARGANGAGAFVRIGAYFCYNDHRVFLNIFYLFRFIPWYQW